MFPIQRKDQNQLVKKLQQKLSELGYNVGPIDGIFGNKTLEAVIEFQKNKKLDIDGIVGPQTWNALFNEPSPSIAVSLEYPPSQSRCFDVYGDFRIKGWTELNLVKCDLSEFQEELKHVYYDWMNKDDKSFVHANWFGFRCHKLVAPKFQEAFRNVVERGLSEQVKTFGGCYNPRFVRGGNFWSTHSWGISIDINSKWNRFGQKDFEMSEELAKCFEDVGLIWGGRWTGFPDAMHFQYATIR